MKNKSGAVVAIVGVLVIGAIVVLALNNKNGSMADNQNLSSSTKQSTVDTTKERTFTVTITNVSKADTLKTSTGGVPVPLSPGVYAVYEGENPIFTAGQKASEGVENIAEDGFPMVLAKALKAKNLIASGVFDSPGGPMNNPAIFPSETTTFTVTLKPGQLLDFETMFVQSNDLFIASEKGINLFDQTGQPITGDITNNFKLWDAGTEVNEEPGVGKNTKPFQEETAEDVGQAENGVIKLASDNGDGYTYPAVSDVIRVSVTAK